MDLLEPSASQRSRGIEMKRADIAVYIDSLLQPVTEQVQTRRTGERNHSAAHLCVIGSCYDNNSASLWNPVLKPRRVGHEPRNSNSNISHMKDSSPDQIIPEHHSSQSNGPLPIFQRGFSCQVHKLLWTDQLVIKLQARRT